MKKTIRILVAEPIPDIQDLYRVILDPVADVIDFARDIPEALTMVEKCSYDVVFLDVGVPDLDGLEGAEILNEIHPELPIVVTSSIKLPVRLAAFLMAHPRNYLVQKPFDIREIRELVRLACCSEVTPEELVLSMRSRDSDSFLKAI